MSPQWEAWVAKAKAVDIGAVISARGIKLKRSGKELIGPCPKCGGDDRFGVSLTERVFNCRRCGTAGDVIDLVKFLDGCDFERAVETLAREEKPSPTNGRGGGLGTIAETYDYTDKDGKARFQVVRYKPKGFRQRRPNGKGGWIWNLNGVELVPYHLLQLIEGIANEHPAIIVEGEKDVHTAEAHGLVATCNPMGAGKWRDEYDQYFAGADVIVIPDNDEPGRRHAQTVAAHLSKVARSVRMLTLSAKDLTAWVEAGGKREELDTLIACAPDYRADAGQATALGEWNAGDDVDLPPPRGWLLGNSFCRKFLSSLFGAGGEGKSALRYAQALAAAAGKPITGEHIFQRCRVLIISLEDDADELRRRMLAARLHHNITLDDVDGWLYLAAPGGKAGKLMTRDQRSRKLEEGELRANLKAAIVKYKIDLVMVDPFVKSHGVEENDNNGMDAVAQVLTDLATKYDIAVDAPHHISKGQPEPGDAMRGRGASSVPNAMRLVYTLTAMSPEEAATFNIPEEDRRDYVRYDRAKTNLVRASGPATWFHLVGVRLGNETERYPNGDDVQTVETWAPKNAWAGTSAADLNKLLDDIDRGMVDEDGNPNGRRYSNAPRASERAVLPLVQEHYPQKTEGECRTIIHAWLDSGLLYPDDYDDPVDRKSRKGLYVDASKRPS